MNKCIKIMWHMPVQPIESVLLNTIQRCADSLSVEGILCIKTPQLCEIIVAGEKQSVDTFLDEVYRIIEAPQTLGELEIIAAAKERDYRGIFRVMV